MKAPKAAWLSFLAIVWAVGAGLVLLAYTITGQHARGRWIEPAKVIGLVIVFLAAVGVLLVLRIPRNRDR